MGFDDQQAGEGADLGATLAADTRSGTGEIEGSSTGPGRGFGELAIGDRLGRYRIEHRLGAGGMGEVFAAREEGTTEGELVALKVLGKTKATALYRFKREFRALADVDHPNLISLRELVVPREGPAFFTMELVDGVPFTDYVRGRTPPGHMPNALRLERALRQLIAGIQALHVAGCLHRDLKPSNVLVTREGRVVILDFGLVSERGRGDEGVTHDGALLGTPAYMAPEQAISGQAGPAADFYALGVMLFECLTGELPFKGSAMQVMMAKHDGEIPDPRAITAEVPDELRSLCMKLLTVDPDLRPTGLELAEGFGEPGPSPGASLSQGSIASLGDSSTGSGRRVPFVGRREELAHFDAALRDVGEAQATITVHLHGASGLGKSALIARFLSRVRRKHDALVLRGRCLERESVPYKGVDALIDALSIHLRRLPGVEAAALQPRNVASMIRLFPVLADVWDKVQPAPSTLGPAEQRRQGQAALRELIVRLADRRPLLLCIDDFHWADTDSVRLLSALLRPPDPPALLLILAYRDDLGRRRALRELVEPSALEGRDIRDLELRPLAADEARRLASELLLAHRPSEDEGEDIPSLAASYAERAGGNPLFISQMVLGAGEWTGSAPDLDDLVARRVVELDAKTRELLASLAIAGGPLPLTAVELLVPDAELRDQRLGALRGAGLIVGGSSAELDGGSLSVELGAEQQSFELAHSRVRDVVIADFDPAELEALHLRLGEALEQLGADAETLAELFARGGEAERAAAYTEQAAAAAAEALAFARAVELYRRSLELLPRDKPERRRELTLELARQLVNLGHGPSAAELLLELAVTAEPTRARQLRRRAVEQLVRSGRIDESLDLSKVLLGELGEAMPMSDWRAIRMIVGQRVPVWLRRGLPALREESEVPDELLVRLDTILAIGTGLSLHEVIISQALLSRALRLAYEAAEPRRLGLVLSYEISAFAGMGRFEQARAKLIEARELAAKVDDVELDRAIDLSSAMMEWFAGDLRRAGVRMAQLLERIERSPGSDWIRAYATLRYAETCQLTGRLTELRRGLPGWLATAREHGNLHELAALEGLAATGCLHFDDLDGARRHLEAGREIWDSSRYTFTDATLDLSEVNVLLYAGELDEALAHIDRFGARLRASGMGRFKVIANMVEQARGKALVRAVLRSPADRRLLARLRANVARGRKHDDPLYRGECLINEAVLHAVSGAREQARRCLRAAEIHCDKHDMEAQLCALRMRLAAWTRGRESADYEAAAEAYLRSQAIPNPRRFADLHAPAHLR